MTLNQAQAAAAPGQVRAAVQCCPGCSLPVIPTGRVLLDAKPDPLGVFRVDGTPMLETEWRKFWSAERPVGRRVHVCGAQRVGAS